MKCDIIYNRKGNWADTVDLSIECKNKKNIALFITKLHSKLNAEQKKLKKKFKKFSFHYWQMNYFMI